MQKAWHELEINELLGFFHVDRRWGRRLSDIRFLQEKFGINNLPEERNRPFLLIFLGQFLSPLIYLLLFAAAIAFWIGDQQDAFVILFVVLLNSLLGAIQEGRAEASIAALRRLFKLKSRVFRDGQFVEIEASELVPGDIFQVSSGDSVPTDGRLIEAVQLNAAEAALTGESIPIIKNVECLPAKTAIADQTNMIFAGTHIISGRGLAVAVTTGAKNELGKIAALTKATGHSKIHFEKRLHEFGKAVVTFALALFLLLLGLGLLHGIGFSDIFMVAVSQMVSIVPEGLPVAMTISLAVGVQRMAGKQVIIRKLSAVESLGATTVICSDKTGTLTKNEMTVVHVVPPGFEQGLRVTGTGYNIRGEFHDLDKNRQVAVKELLLDTGFQRLMKAAVCCNDAEASMHSSMADSLKIVGHPTEGALLVCAMKAGLEIGTVRSKSPRLAEIPFDPVAKMMATQHLETSGKVIYIKGAPEVLWELCKSSSSQAEKVWHEIEKYKARATAMAEDAERVLAFGVVDGFDVDLGAGFNALRGHVQLIGLIGQIDPPREKVAEAIKECKQAGIRPVMITGDHKSTAFAVAKNLGLAESADQTISGLEMELMSEDDLARRLDQVHVFARVHPEQKLRVVQALQDIGHVVAMTGDGVNDAPALAQADVGVAMGQTGTEVAKEASKMVITDDNFATIVAAVAEGRLVQQNIKKLLLFLFVTSIDEVFVLFFAILFGFQPPLAAVQILWLNLVSESALTINLIMEPM